LAIQIGDDVIGDYRVIGEAGTGGMGTVYKIEHVITRRIEAMKLLPGGLPADPEQEQRFGREMQVQARLQHPNIAALYNAVRDGQTMALMEYVEGESLQHMLEGGPLPLRAAIDFSCQALSALAYAHRAGVIHRDVSPANVIITPTRVAKLTDFGLARAKTDLRVTTSGAPIGSFWYMSPEQVRGLEPIDGRTDIYALGAVLYEMLTGAKLFPADGAFAIMSAHVETMPQPPSSRLAGIPRGIDAIVLKALSKDPAARFQSAEEFRLALTKALPGSTPAIAPRKHLSRTAVLAMLPAVLVGCVAMGFG
jgi:serine/threonine-protein kinase